MKKPRSKKRVSGLEDGWAEFYELWCTTTAGESINDTNPEVLRLVFYAGAQTAVWAMMKLPNEESVALVMRELQAMRDQVTDHVKWHRH